MKKLYEKLLPFMTMTQKIKRMQDTITYDIIARMVKRIYECYKTKNNEFKMYDLRLGVQDPAELRSTGPKQRPERVATTPWR